MEFAEIKKLYKTGSITEEQVAARIIALRNKPKLPEDLEGDDIDEIMNFSPEYLNRYEEQFKSTQNSLKEKEKLIELMKADTERKMSEKDAKIASQVDIIKEKENENTELRNQIDEFNREKANETKKKEHRKNIWRFVWSITWKVLILAAITALAIVLENIYNSKIPTYISVIFDFFGIVYTLWGAVKKDKAKYLPRREKPSNPQI